VADLPVSMLESNMDKRLKVVANFFVRQEDCTQVEPILRELMQKSLQERGCLGFEFLQNRDNPGQYTFLEEWLDDSCFSDHLTVAHLLEARDKLKGMLIRDQDVLTYRIL
jgi:quinol monooxygenase YgiN